MLLDLGHNRAVHFIDILFPFCNFFRRAMLSISCLEYFLNQLITADVFLGTIFITQVHRTQNIYTNTYKYIMGTGLHVISCQVLLKVCSLNFCHMSKIFQYTN